MKPLPETAELPASGAAGAAQSPGCIEESGMGMFFRHGGVYAAVDVGDLESLGQTRAGRWMSIYEWSSETHGKGDTVRALQWLREQGFTHVGAHGVGALDEVDGKLVPDPSMSYWAHMIKKGLVDEMFDDEGRKLQVSADGAITFIEKLEQPGPGPVRP